MKRIFLNNIFFTSMRFEKNYAKTYIECDRGAKAYQVLSF